MIIYKENEKKILRYFKRKYLPEPNLYFGKWSNILTIKYAGSCTDLQYIEKLSKRYETKDI